MCRLGQTYTIQSQSGIEEEKVLAQGKVSSFGFSVNYQFAFDNYKLISH